MTTITKSRSWWLAAVALTTACALACGKPAPTDDEETPTPAVTANCPDDGATLQLDCPAMPYTNATGAFDQTSGVLDYDLFAWNSFIAMNWPALDPAANNNQRGIPDLSKSFAGAAPDDLAVWETYKEKREIFLANPFTKEPVADPQVQPWNAEPVYGPADQQVPLCPGVGALKAPFERHITQASKATFDTLDETAEVASEAREANSVLCQGHAADCGVQGQPVGPRVWLNRAQGSVPVLYEVKVNWDFYNYLANFSGGPLWVQDNARAAAPEGSIRLPARTSGPGAPSLPGSSFDAGGTTPAPVAGPNPIVAPYTSSACLSLYEGVTSTSDTTPCPEGSVHLKAAWVPLDAPSSDHHTAVAYYYRDYTPMEGQPGYPEATKCKAPAYYGLIGLHIIQRIHQLNTDGLTHTQGGTFVFATWEHTANDTSNFTYANLFPTTSDTPQPYPNVSPASAIPLKRAYAPLTSTEKANQLVHQALGCSGSEPSVWCNYKLIGTQFLAINGPPPGFDTSNPPDVLPSTPMTTGYELPVGSGQPYFLANLVVESNVGLQQFLGLPPHVTPIAHYGQPQVPPGGTGTRTGNDGVAGNPNDTYSLTSANLAFRIAPRTEPAWNSDQTTRDAHKTLIHASVIGTTNGSSDSRKIGAHNMGGCMGCHGVAQVNGYSFSFVLLGNQTGGVPDTLTEVDIPPPPIGLVQDPAD